MFKLIVWAMLRLESSKQHEAQAHNLHVTIPSDSFYNSAFIAN